MYRVFDAFKALKNRWVISILLLVQFTYGLSTITGTGNILYNLYYMNSKSALELDSTYLVVPEGGLLSTGNITKEQVEMVYNKLKDHQDIISFGTYSEETILLNTETYTLDSRLVEAFTRSPLTSGLKEPFINGIAIDEKYNELLEMKLDKGHSFTKEDFKKNSNKQTNILVGSFFKKFYEIGDLINDQYKIIGFLPNKYIVNANTANTYLKLDKAVIMPMDTDRYSSPESIITRFQSNTILKLKPDANREEITRILQIEGSVPLKLKNLGEDIRQNIRENTYMEIPQIVLGISFILFSVIGIVVTTIVSIMIRKREFGIKRALGESNTGILAQITIENLIIGFLGMVISLAHFKWKYKTLIQMSKEINVISALDFKLNSTIFISIFLVCTFIILTSSFFIYLFIRKQELKSLIGGME